MDLFVVKREKDTETGRHRRFKLPAEALIKLNAFRPYRILDAQEDALPERDVRTIPDQQARAHGLMGAIGEQLGLAWTLEQDVQRLIATRDKRASDHHRLVQRATCESASYFTLGATHSLANLVLRLLLLNADAAAFLVKTYDKANGFRPGSDERTGWITLNRYTVRDLRRAAAKGHNTFMSRATDTLRTLEQSRGFRALDHRRGMDYHRRRPQSVEHASPRKDVVVHEGGMTTIPSTAPSWSQRLTSIGFTRFWSLPWRRFELACVRSDWSSPWQSGPKASTTSLRDGLPPCLAQRHT